MQNFSISWTFKIVQRWHIFSTNTYNDPNDSYIVGPGLFCIHPLPVPVEESHKEERPPEDEVSHWDHEEHLDPSDPLPLHPLNVHPDPVSWGQSPLLKQTVFVGEMCVFFNLIFPRLILFFRTRKIKRKNTIFSLFWDTWFHTWLTTSRDQYLFYY